MRCRKRFVFVNLDACMASQGVTLTVLQQLKACPHTIRPFVPEAGDGESLVHTAVHTGSDVLLFAWSTGAAAAKKGLSA